MIHKYSLLLLSLFAIVTTTQARRMRPMTPLDGEWIINKIANSTTAKKVKLQNTKGDWTMTINDYNKNFSASVGCNTMSGSYTSNQSLEIKIGEIASTMMACDDAKMKNETKLNNTLHKVTNYAFSKDFSSIILFNKKTAIMILTKKNKMVENANYQGNSTSQEPRYSKAKEENYTLVAQQDNSRMVQIGTKKTSFIIDNDRKRFSANVGCNTINGRWEALDDGTLAPFNCVSTEMACPDMVDGLEEKFKQNLNLINRFEKTSTGLQLFHDTQLLLEMASK